MITMITTRNSHSSGVTPYTGSAGVSFALWRAGRLTALPQALKDEAHRLAASALQQVHPLRVLDESLLDGVSLSHFLVLN